MAVTIIENRTVLDEADTVTNFNQGSQNTSNFAESNASVSLAVDTDTDQLFWTGTAVDFTAGDNQVIYVWSSNTALQNSWQAGVNSSHAMWLSDGTNQLVLMQAGNDREVFKHALAQVQFQCFVFDVDYLNTKDAYGEIFANAGSVAAFNPAAVTEVGAYYVTNSKALGGGFNTFIDVIRYGSLGITINGGTSGDSGTFLEIATEDRSTADQRALGVIREYTANTFGCQGTLQFGVSAATADSFFNDDGVSITFEDRDVNNDKFQFIVQGNATDSNNFTLTNSSIVSARPGVTVDMSSNNIDVLSLDSVIFRNLIRPVSFPTDSASFSHSVTNCTFDNCGRVDPGTVTLSGCTFSNSTVQPDGAMLLDSDGTTNMSNLSFVSGDFGHGILITATGTYDFTNFTFSGYGADGTTDAAVFNNSGGSVIINILSGGDSPTVRNSSGSSTTINNPKTLTISNIRTNSEIRILRQSDNVELDGTEQVVGELEEIVSIVNGGSGYSVDDILTVDGGTGTSATIRVNGVGGGGEVTAASIETVGSYTADPPNPASVTGGTGSGAKFNLKIRGSFSHQYNFVEVTPIFIVAFNLLFKEIRQDADLLNADQDIPIQQSVDRNYANP